MSGIDAQVKAAMQAVLDHLKQELKSLRTGRANAGMLDKVQAEVYESYVPIKNIANISVPEARQIVVTPFDHANLNAIAKGIEMANIGLRPIVDGKVIRIPVPAMDESSRRHLAKQCKDHGEKSKIAVRDVRRKFNELVRKMKADGALTEDVLKKEEKTIQDLTDRFCKDVDTTCSEKEKEILTI